MCSWRDKQDDAGQTGIFLSQYCYVRQGGNDFARSVSLVCQSICVSIGLCVRYLQLLEISDPLAEACALLSAISVRVVY